MDDKSGFSLWRATLDDVPHLSHIADRAFEDDTHTQFKGVIQPEGTFRAGMADGLKQWIQTADRCVVLKATDNSNGSIAGWITWAFRGVGIGHAPEATGPTTTAEVNVDLTARDAQQRGHLSPLMSPSTRSPAPEVKAEAAARMAELERLTSGHLAAFQDRIMPEGARCMYIIATAVDPAYRGQGVASQLVRWGTARADSAGVFCWVHSSEAGWRMFARHGFEEVDRLTIDLDEWAPTSGEMKRVWGEYTFRYMVRQPLADILEK